MHFPSQLVPIRLTIGREEIAKYAQMSDDFNPIHMNADAAREAGMKDAIAHGTLSLNLVWESIEKSLDLSRDPELSLDIRFKAPVYQDNTVETGSVLKSENGDYEVWVSNQDGVRVIEGTLQVRSGPELTRKNHQTIG